MKILTLGKRLVPSAQIAYVEPYDPASNPGFKPEKDFKSRIVLTNRDTVLAEMLPMQFAEEHGLKYLAEDQLALNGEHVFFWVETFEPTEKFKPLKHYQSRLKWRAPDGSEHSRLLLMEPAIVAAMAANQSAEDGSSLKKPPQRPLKSRRKLKEIGAARTQ